MPTTLISLNPNLFLLSMTHTFGMCISKGHLWMSRIEKYISCHLVKSLPSNCSFFDCSANVLRNGMAVSDETTGASSSYMVVTEALARDRGVGAASTTTIASMIVGS